MKSSEWNLNLNGVVYNSEQLKSGIFSPSFNSFERSTLEFCHNWLIGAQTFTLHTSGSTGTPKEITITRGQMEASANLTINALNLKPTYTALVCLDTKYIAGQMMLVRSLLLGMNIIAVDPIANPFEKIPLSQSIDFAALVPFQLQSILDSSFRSRLDGLKCVIIGGAPIEPSTTAEIESMKCLFFATYGMTETISHIALKHLTHDDYFKVLDGIDIGMDERGCLTIKADYLGSKEIITNDLVEIIDTNKFKWIGRWDNIINSGGIKVSPEKIEPIIQEIFNRLKISNRFFIAGIPDNKLTEKVILVTEGIPFSRELFLQLEKEFEVGIYRYERPKEIRFVHVFFQTETGKVRRAETLGLIPASSHDHEF